MQSSYWGSETDWDRVSAARRLDEVAWRELVHRYRRPISGAIRRRLVIYAPRLDVDEVTDDFFTYLFAQDVIASADRERGRFRAYLQGVIKRYLLGVTRRRKGKAVPMEESVPGDEPAEIVTADEVEWAMALFKEVRERFVNEHPAKAELLFQAFGVHPFELKSREELAGEMRIQRNAVYQALHRAKLRFREVFVERIRGTVNARYATEEEVAEEIRLILGRVGEQLPGILDEEQPPG